MIFPLVKKFRNKIVLMTGLLLIDGLISTFATIGAAPIIDTILKSSNGNSEISEKIFSAIETLGFSPSLANLIITFLSLHFFKAILLILIKTYLAEVKYVFLKEVMIDMSKAFLSSSWLFFSRNEQGKLLNTFQRELYALGDTFTSIGLALTSVINIIVYAAIAFWINWKLSSAFILSGLAFYLPIRMIGKLNYRFGKSGTETANDFTSMLSETLANTKVIMAFHFTKEILTKLSDRFDKHKKASVRLYGISSVVSEFVNPIGLTVLLLSIYFIRNDATSVSEVAIVGISLKYLSSALGALVQAKTGIQRFLPSLEQINELKEEAQSYEISTNGTNFVRFNKSIGFDSAAFSYNNKDLVFENLSFEILKNQMVALTGHSGKGKSTILDILMGLLPLSSGRLTIDGEDYNSYNLTSIRDRIGYVPQEPVLFDLSIRENLLLANPLANQQALEDACQLAQATEFISKLPGQLDYKVGHRGTNLSGGQRQRVALARALVREPELLILDEPTSALDIESTNKIFEAILELKNKTTIVLVTHDPALMEKADQLISFGDQNVTTADNVVQ